MSQKRLPRRPRLDTKPAAKPSGGQPGNQNARTHGFYSISYSPEELALLATFVDEPSLEDEIWMQRVLNQRLMTYTQAQDTAGKKIQIATLIKIAQALTTGTGRVAKLLRDRRVLTGGATTQLEEAVATILDEVGRAHELDL
jgi:hypothetical protein